MSVPLHVSSARTRLRSGCVDHHALPQRRPLPGQRRNGRLPAFAAGSTATVVRRRRLPSLKSRLRPLKNVQVAELGNASGKPVQERRLGPLSKGDCELLVFQLLPASTRPRRDGNYTPACGPRFTEIKVKARSLTASIRHTQANRGAVPGAIVHRFVNEMGDPVLPTNRSP